MTDKMLEKLGEKYALKEVDPGEFANLKANRMKFTVSAYDAEGMGRVSVMKAKGFFGLIKMDTVIVTPYDVDLPLYSYDRMKMFGADILISEMYDTTVSEGFDASEIDKINAAYADLTDRDPGNHWYDSIRLTQSVSKTGKKPQAERMDSLAIAHFEAWLSSGAPAVEDAAAKRERTEYYVNGLLTGGGPSTDVFKKSLGDEKTAKLFISVLFGLDK